MRRAGKLFDIAAETDCFFKGTASQFMLKFHILPRHLPGLPRQFCLRPSEIWAIPAIRLSGLPGRSPAMTAGEVAEPVEAVSFLFEDFCNPTIWIAGSEPGNDSMSGS